MDQMAEPASTTIASAGAIKFGLVSGVGALLASVIVMAKTHPSSKTEWASALTTTVAGSILGGSFLIQKYALASWIDQGFFGVAALCGVIFTAGLPFWVVVRAFFRYAELNKDKSLLDLIVAVKAAIWDKKPN